MLGGTVYKNSAGAMVPGWMLRGDLVYPWTSTYEPDQADMVASMAKRTGHSPLELCYELLLDVEGDHAGVLWRPLFGYTGNNEMSVEGLQLPHIIPGFDDAGAHCTILTDATCATSNIAYYGYRRAELGIGRVLPLERVVKTQTKDAAEIF